MARIVRRTIGESTRTTTSVHLALLYTYNIDLTLVTITTPLTRQ